MKASELDFSKLPNFTESEFDGQLSEHHEIESMLPFLQAKIVLIAQDFRTRLGGRLRPSKAPGALCRVHKHYSRHSCVGRLSDALDFQVIDNSLIHAYNVALDTPGINGIGLYPDWSIPGIHIDHRSGPRKVWMARYKTDGGKRVQVYSEIDWPYLQGLRL